MITEIAEIDVIPGKELAFEGAVAVAVALFRDAAGCHHLRLERSIEHSSRYLLLVSWETVEHHIIDFRDGPLFPRWRELVSAYFARPPRVEHTRTVLDAF